MSKAPRRKLPAPALAANGDALLSSLSGVGPRAAEKLAAHGLMRLQDLWLHLQRDVKVSGNVIRAERHAGTGPEEHH